MKNDLLKIITHYGSSHQIKKLNEECFELQEALIRAEEFFDWGLGDEDLEHIVEEMADVQIMLEQFKVYYQEHYGITNERINKVMEYKINRQLERITDENN